VAAAFGGYQWRIGHRAEAQWAVSCGKEDRPEEEDVNVMKTKDVSWLSVVVCVLVVGVLAMSGCAAPEQTADEAAEEMTAEATAIAVEEEAAEEMVEYLFVQHAEGVTLQDGVLTLEGVGDDILYFSDRPHRIVGRETLEKFLEAWTEGEESFAEVPPNAVLTVRQEDELRDLTVVLKDPVLTEGNLAYQVEVLDGPDAGSGEFAALFIDVIGAPFVGPTSVRGVARRTARRTTRRVNRRQDYYDEATDYDDDGPYDDGPYDDDSELEERLRELDDLLDQGLITQEDYDREKEELLRQY